MISNSMDSLERCESFLLKMAPQSDQLKEVRNLKFKKYIWLKINENKNKNS